MPRQPWTRSLHRRLPLCKSHHVPVGCKRRTTISSTNKRWVGTMVGTMVHRDHWAQQFARTLFTFGTFALELLCHSRRFAEKAFIGSVLEEEQETTYKAYNHRRRRRRTQRQLETHLSTLDIRCLLFLRILLNTVFWSSQALILLLLIGPFSTA